jgi:ABC-type Fe3+/spermidine/putrescine transport system ATPase subunit
VQEEILQIGAPKDLYHFPLNRKVGEFLGSMNEFDGTPQSNGCVKTDLGVVSCAVPNGTAKE